MTGTTGTTGITIVMVTHVTTTTRSPISHAPTVATICPASKNIWMNVMTWSVGDTKAMVKVKVKVKVTVKTLVSRPVVSRHLATAAAVEHLTSPDSSLMTPTIQT